MAGNNQPTNGIREPAQTQCATHTGSDTYSGTAKPIALRLSIHSGWEN